MDDIEMIDIVATSTSNDEVHFVAERPRNCAPSKQRKPAVEELSKMISHTDEHVGIIRPGHSVELDTGDFLRVKKIARHKTTQEVVLQGYRMQRHAKLGGMLQNKQNDVVLCYEVTLDDARHPRQQALVVSPL